MYLVTVNFIFLCKLYVINIYRKKNCFWDKCLRPSFEQTLVQETEKVVFVMINLQHLFENVGVSKDSMN